LDSEERGCGFKIDYVVEILIWLVIAVTIFYVCNVIAQLRTVASLFLAFLASSAIVSFFFSSVLGEVVIMFAIIVGTFYAISRATRDFRDDNGPNATREIPKPHSADTQSSGTRGLHSSCDTSHAARADRSLGEIQVRMM
jgi:hypothetical protein